MKLGHSADEIKFGGTQNGISRYILMLDGEPTMYVLCDTTDTAKTIRIAPATIDTDNLTSDTIDLVSRATKGQFQVTTKLLEGPDGEPLGTETRVDEKSVYTYVVPRLHVLLGRLLRAAA